MVGSDPLLVATRTLWPHHRRR